MIKMGRPKKNPSESMATVAFYISEKNKNKIVAMAEEKETSASQIVNSIFDSLLA